MVSLAVGMYIIFIVHDQRSNYFSSVSFATVTLKYAFLHIRSMTAFKSKNLKPKYFDIVIIMKFISKKKSTLSMLYVFKRDEIWRDVKFRKWNINVYLNRFFFFNILVQLLIHILKIRRMISSHTHCQIHIFIFFFLLHTPI